MLDLHLMSSTTIKVDELRRRIDEFCSCEHYGPLSTSAWSRRAVFRVARRVRTAAVFSRGELNYRICMFHFCSFLVGLPQSFLVTISITAGQFWALVALWSTAAFYAAHRVPQVIHRTSVCVVTPQWTTSRGH